MHAFPHFLCWFAAKYPCLVCFLSFLSSCVGDVELTLFLRSCCRFLWKTTLKTMVFLSCKVVCFVVCMFGSAKNT